MDLRRIAGLFNENPREYGPISQICSRFMSKSDRLLEVIKERDGHSSPGNNSFAARE
jgi:hypothetical protein